MERFDDRWHSTVDSLGETFVADVLLGPFPEGDWRKFGFNDAHQLWKSGKLK